MTSIKGINLLKLSFVIALVFLIVSGCKSESEESAILVMPPLPSEYAKGIDLYSKYCAKCHGENASGTDNGPPFVHKIYEPNHHGDMSVRLAVQKGVRAHHWKFGDMPFIPGVSEKDVDEIVEYVRWLQRQAGVY